MDRLSVEVSELDSKLDAICELLEAANDAKVHASGLHALLRPLSTRLSAAASDLSDHPAFEVATSTT